MLITNIHFLPTFSMVLFFTIINGISIGWQLFIILTIRDSRQTLVSLSAIAANSCAIWFINSF